MVSNEASNQRLPLPDDKSEEKRNLGKNMKYVQVLGKLWKEVNLDANE